MQSAPGKKTNKILTAEQVQVLKIIHAHPEVFSDFYLTGGTALSAFYLFHRISEDLDFFTHIPLPLQLDQLFSHLCRENNLKVKSIQKTPTFRRFLVENRLQIDFAQDISTRFGTPKLQNNVLVDSLENIAVNKVTTILGRLDLKDYVDLFYLITEKNFNIFDLLEKAKQKDGGCHLFIWSRVINDVQELHVLPKMIKPLTIKKLHIFYQKLQNKILKKLKPKWHS